MVETKKERERYTTTIEKHLIKELKILAAKLDKRQNELLEEAIKLLLEKYKEKEK